MSVLVSPNMGLPVPTINDAGPDWASQINNCMFILDNHTHSSGSGIQIGSSGINLASSLSLNSNDVVFIRSTKYTPQTSVLSNASDTGCLFILTNDLWFNDVSGNHIRLTQNGSIVGSAGSINGLPSGTASVSYSSGSYIFQSATNTPGALNVGPLSIGIQSFNAPTVTITPSVSQSSNYILTLPAVSPTLNQMLISDGSGNLTWNATTGSGNVVRSSAPTFSGVPSGTITASSFSPSLSMASGSINSSTIYQCNYMRVGNVVMGFISGVINYTNSTNTLIYMQVPVSLSGNFSTSTQACSNSLMSTSALPTSANLGSFAGESVVGSQYITIGSTAGSAGTNNYYFSASYSYLVY